MGRFTQLDPIGLAGGDNLYLYSLNILNWIDELGLARKPVKNRLPEGSRTNEFGPPNGTLTQKDSKTGKIIQIRKYDKNGNPIKDIDFGHDHGVGDPHAHDWEYPSDKAPNKVRRDGRSLSKMEKIQMKCSGIKSSILLLARFLLEY